MNFRTLAAALGCLCAGLAVVPSLSATTLRGSFTTDDQLFQYTWNLSQATNAMISTTSYAGGGFVPVLALFNETTGAFLAGDGATRSCSNGRMSDPATGICNDAYLNTSLSAGSYRVVLSEFFNQPNGDLAAGYSEAGQGNFTAAACSATSPFQEVDLAPCVQRTGDYSINLTTSTAATPEPATAWLTIPVLALAAFYLRRRKISQGQV